MLTMKKVALVVGALAVLAACEQDGFAVNDAGPDGAVAPGDGDGDGGDSLDAGDGDSPDAGDGGDGDGDAVGDGDVADGGGGGCKVDDDCLHRDLLKCDDRGVCAKTCASTGECVQCLENADCKGGLSLCNTDKNECVECLSNADCGQWPSTPHCNADTGQCGGCANDDECEPFGLMCREREGGGSCQACIPGEDEETSCPNGKACVASWPSKPSPVCEGAKRGTLESCLRCSNSTECKSGSACVSMLFKGRRSVSYCAPLAVDGVACPKTVATKVSAFFVQDDNTWLVPGDGTAAPANGTAGKFCVPDETISSCASVLEFGNTCNAEEEGSGTCGSWASEDHRAGICVGSPGEMRCTYECKTNADCRTSCVGTDVSYCNPF